MMDEYVAGLKDEDKVTKLMMTEAYASIPETVLWYGKDANTLGAHMPFNFALITELDIDAKAANFSAAINGWMSAMPSYGRANWVMGNHDRPRVGYRYGEERQESLAIMTMMLPGLNVIYYVSILLTFI